MGRIAARATLEECEQLKRLAHAWDCSASEVLRRLIAQADELEPIPPPPAPPLPTEQELLELLASSARAGNVRAAELLLRREDEKRTPAEPSDAPVLEPGDPFAEIDELAARRTRTG